MRWLVDWGPVGGLISEIPEQSSKCQEIWVLDFNKTKEMRGKPGEIAAAKSLARYINACLEDAAGELVDIWFGVKPYSSVFKDVANSIN